MMNSRPMALWLALALFVAAAGPSMFVGADGLDCPWHNEAKPDEKEVCDAHRACTCRNKPPPTESTTTESTTPSSTSTEASTSTEGSTSTTESSTTSGSSTDGSTGSTPKPEPCECDLMDGLKQQCDQELTVDEKSDFEECLNKVREILIDASCPKERKMSRIAKSLKKCCKKDGKKKGSCKKLKYKYLFKFITLGKFISCGAKHDHKLYSKFLFTTDNNGTSNVTRAFEEHIKNDKCGTGSTSQIMAELYNCKKRQAKKLKNEDENKSQKRKQGHSKKCFVKLIFGKFPQWSQCMRDCPIDGFDTLDQALELCGHWQERVSSMGTEFFKGTSSLDCLFIQKVKKHIADKAGTVDAQTLAEANTYAQNCSRDVDSEPDEKARHKKCSDNLKNMSPKGKKFMEECEIDNTTLSYDNETCDLGDVADCESFCNFDCGDNLGKDGGCALTLEEVCMPDAENRSDVVDMCDAHYNWLSATYPSYKASFVTPKEGVRKCCFNQDVLPKPGGKTFPATPEGRKNCSMAYLKNYDDSQSHSSLKPIRDKLRGWPLWSVFYEVAGVLDLLFGVLGALTCGCRS